MLELNLPTCELKFTEADGKIQVWDIIRKKYVAYTPEENVRQHFVNYLVNVKGYPATHLMNEVCLKLNGMSRRCDTVAYGRNLEPKAIVEYKAPDVNITKQVFAQISRYNMVLKVDYLILSNGIKHYCLKTDYRDGTCSFLNDIPSYESL